jgi:hypothetical protein
VTLRGSVVLFGDKVSLHGFVPIKQQHGEDTETKML